VIGADGIHSRVSKAVGAVDYDATPPIAMFYYSYFSGFEADDIEQYVRDYQGAACFPTHDGLMLLIAAWPSHRFHEVREDIEGHVQEVHRSMPSVAERMRSARREEKWIGTAGVPNYFRKPYGPGWALVGDAGYDRDPITAQGISDAFIDADNLASALDAGYSGRRLLDEALAEFHSSRDRRVKPLFHFTCELAKLEPAPPVMQRLFGALRDNRDATGQFYEAITGSAPLEEFMSPQNLERIIGAAANAS
jgi:2-polyprenyl-6-methoxyphenol hydroxylase-like FAD-dependent oxidoreductase